MTPTRTSMQTVVWRATKVSRNRRTRYIATTENKQYAASIGHTDHALFIRPRRSSRSGTSFCPYQPNQSGPRNITVSVANVSTQFRYEPANAHAPAATVIGTAHVRFIGVSRRAKSVSRMILPIGCCAKSITRGYVSIGKNRQVLGAKIMISGCPVARLKTCDRPFHSKSPVGNRGR